MLQIYAAYLDSEVLALLSELRTSEFLVWRLQRLKEHVDNNIHVRGPILFHYVEPNPSHPWGYEQFWSLILALDRKLLKDTDRLRPWGRR